MSPARFLPRADYRRLKLAGRDLVAACGGQSRAAEKVTRIGQQQLSKALSLADEFSEVFLPIDVVLDLEADCETPIVTRVLAELASHQVTPLPELTRAASDVAALMAVVKEGSEAFAKISAAVGDGTVTFGEWSEIEPEIDQLLTAGQALKARMRGGRS